METRKELNDKLSLKKRQLSEIQLEMDQIKKQLCLLCDEEQRYEEKIEMWGKGGKKKQVLVGRIYFPEDFKDESTDEIITIERRQIVSLDNVWYYEADFDKYYIELLG